MAGTTPIKVCVDRIGPRDARRLRGAHDTMAARAADPADPTGPADVRAAVARARMAVLTGKKWDVGRTLQVAFLDGLPEVQQRVIPFARQWERVANLAFDFSPLPAGRTADIRISFEQEGSWSYLGTDARDIREDLPTMNFGWLTPEVSDREYQRVVVHEFGHALGAIHEHQSPGASIPWDKDAVYAYYAGPPNHWSKEEVDVNLFQHYDATITQFSRFDPSSIMLYAIPNEFTVGDWEIGWNTEMSDTDRAFMATMYPGAHGPGPQPPAGGPAHLAIDGTPLKAGIDTVGEEDEFVFDVTDAGTYTIETTGNTDVVLALFGPDTRERRIGLDDDSGRGLNARLRIDLDRGEYHVFVRHYSRRGTGAYRVKVTSE